MCGSIVRLWSCGFITKIERTSGSLWCYRGNVCVSPIMSQRVQEHWTTTWTYHEDRKNVWVTLMIQGERVCEPNNVSEGPWILNDDLDLSWRQRKHLAQPRRRVLIMETDDRNIWILPEGLERKDDWKNSGTAGVGRHHRLSLITMLFSIWEHQAKQKRKERKENKRKTNKT